MRKKLTQAFVNTAAVEPGARRTTYWDQGMPGFGLMVTENGHRSFVVQYRVGRRSRRMTIDGVHSLIDARKKGRKLLSAADDGDPLEERRKERAEVQHTLRAVAETYLKREAKNVRSMDQRRAMLERLVFPKLGARSIAGIQRSELVRLLDKIEDERGPVMADRALATVRRIMSWHASRDDHFRSPIVRGMARTKPGERARERVLSDDEIRALWAAAKAAGAPFGSLVRFLLLTATRRTEAADTTRDELAGDQWLIPAARMKGKRDHLVPLSKMAQAVLAEVPMVGETYVFTTNGDNPISGFSKWKADLDKDSKVTGWTLHDLRRTARSLMSRAGVAPDIAERCLGHVIGGVRGVYDRHEFAEEKARAFETLATQLQLILNPADNVVALRS
jgi:integrase